MSALSPLAAITDGITAFILAFSLLLVALYVAQEIRNARLARAERATDEFLRVLLSGGREKGIRDRKMRRTSPRAWLPILDSWIALSQSVVPDDGEKARIAAFFAGRRADLFFIRKLRSPSVYRRTRSAYYLGFMKTERSAKALSLALRQERKESIKLHLVSSLVRLEAGNALPDILDSIQGCSEEFIQRITGLLIEFQSSFIAYFPELERRREIELRTLIVEYARLAPYRIFAPYLLELFRDAECPPRLRHKAFAVLVTSYPFAANPVDFIADGDAEIRNQAYEALGERPGKANALILLKAALDDTREGHAIAALSNMARRSGQVFLFLIGLLEAEAEGKRASVLSRVLSGRIDYFLLKTGRGSELHERVVRQVLEDGRLSDLIGFLNNNHDVDIENNVVAIIQKHFAFKSPSIDQLRMYLRPTILHKIGLSPLPLPQKRLSERNENVKRAPLVAILVGAVAIYPAMLLLARFGAPEIPWAEALRASVNRYLEAFGIYTFLVNFFYFFLAFHANREADDQRRLYRLKDAAFLFQKNMLPSISILAPAYNEEMNIIASVESLLNVNYPDFEVIVVNDGSKDATLARLIDHFKLEKIDSVYEETLQTQPVRGLYRNSRIPALKVIDKINGGKADSLNVGINVASGEYILGIDSDSILERDSLLALTSAFLDGETPVVASGGNIMPANGCEIRDGTLIRKSVPRKFIPLIQTVEYLRAFMNGRMGWTRLRSLMIISGAFGIFRRAEVLAINGYLTSREKYVKDTVGEDMELVVRLSRMLRERRFAHRILYSYQAFCWTEVPDNLRILKRQRDRWQRGLIDILSFHKKMIFNPAYGRYGLIGFPYYLIVEVIGPWLELCGNIVLVVGLVTGILEPKTIWFLVATNLIFSFALSLYSLYICDKNKPVFPFADRAALILTSLVETLGFRQLFSFFRITGFIEILRQRKGWGTMPRTGLTAPKPASGDPRREKRTKLPTNQEA